MLVTVHVNGNGPWRPDERLASRTSPDVSSGVRRVARPRRGLVRTAGRTRRPGPSPAPVRVAPTAAGPLEPVPQAEARRVEVAPGRAPVARRGAAAGRWSAPPAQAERPLDPL